MPSNDLTPEQYEDLVATDHVCDERCADGSHHHDHDHASVDPLTTALALLECGLGGSAGSIHPGLVSSTLWRKAIELAGVTDSRDNDPKTLARIHAWYDELLAEWEAEQELKELLRRSIDDTAKAVRHVERRREATARRSQPKPDRRAPNKPTRIDVDPAAWNVVKGHAIADGRKVAAVVGELLADPSPPYRSHSAAQPARRFARLFVDDAQWYRLRLTAFTEGVTVMRLTGIIVEREAKRLGWTPGGER